MVSTTVIGAMMIVAFSDERNNEEESRAFERPELPQPQDHSLVPLVRNFNGERTKEAATNTTTPKLTMKINAAKELLFRMLDTFMIE